MRDDIKEEVLSADEVEDRATWRRMSLYIDPTEKVGIRGKIKPGILSLLMR